MFILYTQIYIKKKDIKNAVNTVVHTQAVPFTAQKTFTINKLHLLYVLVKKYTVRYKYFFFQNNI